MGMVSGLLPLQPSWGYELIFLGVETNKKADGKGQDRDSLQGIRAALGSWTTASPSDQHLDRERDRRQRTGRETRLYFLSDCNKKVPGL